jgi:formate hydrogenlyase transcriptional activator
MEDHAEEIRRLQSCIDDLVSLLPLPDLWKNSEAPQVLGTLLDVLVSMLRLDVAYARVNLTGDAPLEVARISARPGVPREVEAIGRALATPLLGERATSPRLVRNPVGAGELSIVQFGLGIENDGGMVVAGSRRAEFPTNLESLLLRMAVNHAVIALQGARVVAERQHAAAIERMKNQLEAENRYLRLERDADGHWNEIVGESRTLKNVLKLVEKVAPTGACVLIQGETGTGKELIARALHRLSGRQDQPFVKLNCAAIPNGLLESELFGHERGAFTGAIARKAGRFELAHRGTMFLDEVGEIPLELQAKLLRVLQEHEFERLGSTRTTRVDVRVVAASNRDLCQMVAEGTFRSDLYYRLKVFPISVPPLRLRAEDIPALVRCFTERHARRCNKTITEIPPETMSALCCYAWPGNVRELENFVERCVILTQGPTLEVPLGELGPLPSILAPSGPAATLEGVEREHIIRTLVSCNWVIAGRSGAAVKLGMKRTSLQYKMQKLGINRPG